MDFPENATVVMVHGAWADGSSWQAIIGALEDRGLNVIAAPIPLTSLSDDAAALERNRTVALSFYHQARQGADVAGLLIHHFVGERFVGLESIFAEGARDLQGLLESHIEHPLIYYFHPPQVHKSLPRMLFLVLEACAVVPDACDVKAGGP